MHWYQGGIADAVSASKKSGAVFVVYIEGNDNKSKELTDLLNTEAVSTQLETQHFVAIKVEENSVPHQQFSQIYTEATVPSLFFIGKAGSPLEIITDLHTGEEFLNKLRSILEKNGVTIVAESSKNLIKSEQPAESSDKTPETTPEVTTVKEQPSTSQNEELNLSPEEKIDRVKELVNQKREAKAVEEEEKTRLKELERRKVGQDVQKLKRWQQENELKELMDERTREKKEQQDARQRVLAQIAQDKAERASKFGNTSPNTQPTNPQLVHRVVNSNTARLQFRLPDGSAHTHEFESSATLQEVRNYVVANLSLSFTNFTMSTTFPRREFTSEDCKETLLMLELVPNAVILILPLYQGAVTTNNGSWLKIFWSVIGPILNIVGYLRSLIFGANPTPPPSSSTQDRQNKRPSESNAEPSSSSKKRMGDASNISRQGNVHRLADKTDSDEDNNTWNGNSTQQM